MKLFALVMASLAVSAVTAAVPPQGSELFRCQVHRGGGRNTRPDNALETFLWCWGHGVAPEADARLTKDGVAIALHDATLKRVGRGIPAELATACVSNLNWSAIRDVDTGSYLDPAYSSTRIATLDSIFAAMAGRPERLLYLDEKGAPPERVAELARKHGVERQIYYTSKRFELMARWQDVVPGGLGMVWLGTWPKDNSPASVAKAEKFLDDTFSRMEASGWKGISQIQIHIRTDLSRPEPFCPSSAYMRKAIKLLHSKGVTVQAFTWTEGANKDVLRKIWKLGFDNIATDDPLVLFELLPELSAPPSSELDLTHVCIVRAARENAQQKMAADDLARHLELITGVKPAEGLAAAKGAATVFSFRRPKEAHGGRLTSFAWREGNTIHFWGDDLPTRGGPQYGSGFAVAEFLERFLGVLWVRPGDEGIVFSRRTSCDVPDDWRWERPYPFYTSLVRGCDPLWGMRMKYAARRPFRYGHAFTKWQDTYLKDHPEYFGLNPYGRRGVEGARSRTAKLCLSNDGCIDQILANWTGARTNQFLNICPNDGTPGYCYCEKCLALDVRKPGESFYSNLTDRYLNFWNRITARARAIRPDVKVVTYIYSYYRHPPRRERIEYPDNMLFGVVPTFRDDYHADLAAWKAAGLKDNTFFLRPNFTAYSGKLPRGQERAIYDCYHHYLENGSFGFDYDGHWAPVMAFEYYVLMRQLAHPDYSFERIEDEFCSQYGACAPAAKAYYARLRARGDKAREMRRAKMAAQQNDVLDDSLLSAFAVEGHTEKDLKEDLAFLESADASQLTDVERKRWETLKTEARGYIEAFTAAEQVAKNPPKLKEEGWRASFDAPGLQGWQLRDLVGGCTVEEASFDRYSVKLKTRAEGGIGLWLRQAPVTPGARYRLEFDVKTAGGKVPVRMRVAGNGQTLASGGLTASSRVWEKGEVSFKVPEGKETVSLYFIVGKGEPDRTLYVDNIVLTRLDTAPVANP